MTHSSSLSSPYHIFFREDKISDVIDYVTNYICEELTRHPNGAKPVDGDSQKTIALVQNPIRSSSNFGKAPRSFRGYGVTLNMFSVAKIVFSVRGYPICMCPILDISSATSV